MTDAADTARPAFAGMRPAEPLDLEAANAVIRACVEGWGLSARVTRLVMPEYLYTPGDLQTVDLWLLIASGPAGAFGPQHAAGVLGLQQPHHFHGDFPERASLIHGLFVDPGQAGRGHGERLLRLAEARAADCGATRLFVKAHKTAVGYFERHGFSRTDAIDYPYALVKTVPDPAGRNQGNHAQ